jgi:hypothetical protein
MAQSLTALRAKSSGESIRYRCAGLMRVFMMLFVKAIYEEKIAFQERGGFKADKQPLKGFADSYPEGFKRKGVMTFDKFLLRYEFDTRPLPPPTAWGKYAIGSLGFVGAILAVLVFVVPEGIWVELKRRWAFYGFSLLFGLAVINKILRMVRG